MLKKLPVGNPGRTFLVYFKRERINEFRFPVEKLNVVSTGVFQGHAKIKRALLNLQSRERGILQLIETPFIGIRNERNDLGPYDFVRVMREFPRHIGFRMRDEKILLAKLLKKSGSHQAIIMIPIGKVYLPVQNISRGKQKSVWITERTQYPLLEIFTFPSLHGSFEESGKSNFLFSPRKA